MDEDIHASAVRLQLLATRMLRLARSAHADHKLTSAQYSAMSVLHERGALPLGELARAERVSHPTMSRIIGGLVRLSLVARSPEASDRRLRHVALTPEGRVLYEQVASNRVAMMAAIIAQLTPATRADVLEVVTRIASDLEDGPGQD